MRGHPSSRLGAISSWTFTGTLTLVLSATAVALMSHAPTGRAPLAEPTGAHSPTSVPSTLAPAPVVTYTYSGDDGSSGAYGSSASGGYGDD